MVAQLAGRPAPWVVAALSLAASAVYAVLGVGFVLDDWFTIRNAHFDGAWAAAGADQNLARPGAALVYALVFGPLGTHPLAVLALQASIGVGTALLLLDLLRRYLPAELALAATLLWVVLPNHTSLEVWASAANIALSLLLTLGGARLLVADRRGALPASLVLFVAGALCYEAIIPLAGALIVVLPWLERGRPDLRAIGGGVLSLGAVAVWIVVNWHPSKEVAKAVPDLSQVVPAHFGWGIAPAGLVSDLLAVGALIGIVVCLVRLRRPTTRGPAELAVLAGVAVIAVGVLPFVRYQYAPLGAGDRFSFVSSVGGALVWAGLLAVAWQARRELAVVGAVVLVGLAAVVRLDRAQTWSDAGADAVAIQQAVTTEIPAPDGVVVLGPEPIVRDNVAAFLDQSNVVGALQVAYDDESLRFGIAFSQEQFEAYPEERRFDLRTVSVLEPAG